MEGSAEIWRGEFDEEDARSISRERLQRICRIGSVSGGLAAAAKGAMSALPTWEKVRTILVDEGAL
ncbi:hypothetical protein BSNK01_04310 [Bacillaceae bacterium]